MSRFTLTKAERLCAVKDIDRLFAEGKSLSKYPLRLVWLEVQTKGEHEASPVQVLFSASKKRYNKAVDRNRIKRLMREAYRMHKPFLLETIPQSRYYQIAFLYTGSEILSQAEIQKSLITALKRWLQEITIISELPQADPGP